MCSACFFAGIYALLFAIGYTRKSTSNLSTVVHVFLLIVNVVVVIQSVGDVFLCDPDDSQCISVASPAIEPVKIVRSNILADLVSGNSICHTRSNGSRDGGICPAISLKHDGATGRMGVHGKGCSGVLWAGVLCG